MTEHDGSGFVCPICGGLANVDPRGARAPGSRRLQCPDCGGVTVSDLAAEVPQ
jgi:predicted RNA-binding Zn-ribbon protein involved in translation (DUF1610 family)